MTNMKVIEKIDRQCESLRAKIAALSGTYLTNTWKRQNEQRHRDTQKEQLRQQLEFYEYLKNEAAARELSPFEIALLVGTFYNEIRVLMTRQQYYEEHPNNSVRPVQFPENDSSFSGKLIKAGIRDTGELQDSLSMFVEMLRNAVAPTDPNAARMRDLVFEARLRQSGDIQFTPDALAERMVVLAGIDSGSKVLEPEAGIAAIADKVKAVTADVDCIEIEPDFCEILKLKGYNLVARNLFEYKQQPIYDAVLMNPPFSAEIEHIRYAFDLLKPGGSLVAVCSPRFTYIKNKGYPEFRDWLEQHGLSYENAGRDFEMTGTSALVLKIKKEAEVQAA